MADASIVDTREDTWRVHTCCRNVGQTRPIACCCLHVEGMRRERWNAQREVVATKVPGRPKRLDRMYCTCASNVEMLMRPSGCWLFDQVSVHVDDRSNDGHSIELRERLRVCAATRWHAAVCDAIDVMAEHKITRESCLCCPRRSGCDCDALQPRREADRPWRCRLHVLLAVVAALHRACRSRGMIVAICRLIS